MENCLSFSLLLRNQIDLLKSVDEELAERAERATQWGLELKRYTPIQDHHKEVLLLVDDSSSRSQYLCVSEKDEIETWSSAEKSFEVLVRHLNQTLEKSFTVAGKAFKMGDFVLKIGPIVRNGAPTKDLLAVIQVLSVHSVKFNEENLRALLTSAAKSLIPSQLDLSDLNESVNASARMFFQTKSQFERPASDRLLQSDRSEKQRNERAPNERFLANFITEKYLVMEMVRKFLI